MNESIESNNVEVLTDESPRLKIPEKAVTRNDPEDCKPEIRDAIHVSVDDIPSVIDKVYDQSILFVGNRKESEPIGALWRNNEKKDGKFSA